MSTFDIFVKRQYNRLNIYKKEEKMEDIKLTIARNISALRLSRSLTQIELAEKLNYSDKAVSKWERGESIPDISVLIKIADLFSVSLDYLVRESHPIEEVKKIKPRYNRGMIVGVSLVLVWLISLASFVITTLSISELYYQWLAFIYAVPVCMIVWLVFNSIWFNKKRNYLIISLLMWTTLAATHISLALAGIQNIWLIYLLGIPGQFIIFFWSKIKRENKDK